jgi:glycosyltransferase involved in cell wall biosynthesis
MAAIEPLDAQNGQSIAVVLKGYPRLSETFIAQEILALQERGLRQHIVSLRHPTDRKTHALNDAITAPVSYLPEYLHQEPLRVLRAWRVVRKRPGYAEAKRSWWQDLKRDPTRNRLRRWGQALVLAAELPDHITHLYAHFLHTPASVTRYAAHILALPWSVSAHAKDIWTSPEWEKREKLADCAWAVTCTGFGAKHLAGLAVAAGAPADRVALLYHGLDLCRFPQPLAERSRRDGSSPDDPVRILSVGRAVAKKGYEDLLVALASLPSYVHWHFTHIGGGSLIKGLQKEAIRLGIAARITWQGAQAQDKVIAAYGEADLFVLASKIAKDGDRDGLPNVLMEAQSQGLICLASDVAGIPELITHGENGVLAPPGDPAELAEALLGLIRDPASRLRMGMAGALALRRGFSFEDGVDRLGQRFGLKPAAARRAAE